ncbi:hypothetical protein C8F01DRAFT_1231877 [Mycena amicta]|nr:hypothetical protein C8F01DRAFT_1231877 [Mycena amicta]
MFARIQFRSTYDRDGYSPRPTSPPPAQPLEPLAIAMFARIQLRSTDKSKGSETYDVISADVEWKQVQKSPASWAWKRSETGAYQGQQCEAERGGRGTQCEARGNVAASRRTQRKVDESSEGPGDTAASGDQSDSVDTSTQSPRNHSTAVRPRLTKQNMKHLPTQVLQTISNPLGKGLERTHDLTSQAKCAGIVELSCKFQDTDTEDTSIGTTQLKGNHYPPLHHFSDAIRLGVGRLAILYEGDHHSEPRNNRDTQTYTRTFGGLPVARSPSNISNPRARRVQTILYKRHYRTSIGQDFLAEKHHKPRRESSTTTFLPTTSRQAFESPKQHLRPLNNPAENEFFPARL